ncbi:MAG: sialate O-acetylesterase [Planctomycetota bacterium]
MKRVLAVIPLLSSLFFASPTQAEVTLPSVISDHMVLQRDAEVRIWGWAEPGEEVMVFFGEPGSSEAGKVFVVADDAGEWEVMLPEQAGGVVFELRITGSATEGEIVISDVVFGEVWVASGQSNMEWRVRNSDNAQEEIANANHPGIRMWSAQRRVAGEPQRDVPGQWQVCSPQTVGGFSAVGYYFARELYQRLDIPVGILHSSWGGTPSEAWTSRDKLDTVESAGPILERYDTMLEGYDERLAAFEEALAEYNAKLNGPDMTREETGFPANDYDDSAWDTATLPRGWAASGHGDLDGIMWYRRTVTVPEAWAGQALVLELGPIDDYDVTWFNGEQVGSTQANVNNAWQTPRVYNIPAELVVAGEVAIAIRVFDPHGGGGLHGDAAQMKLRPADATLGEPIELAGDWRYNISHELDPADASNQRPARPVGPDHPHSPAGLFNGMIAPITPYTIRGAIWYQGESNAPRAEQYETLFPAMIHDWREQWGVGEFPFLFVQLANFRAYSEQPTDTPWSHLQNAQLNTLHTVPNTGMATIIDIGDANDIHPRNKQDVGRRLALWALADTYGQDDVVKSGPIYESAEFGVVEGSATLHFKTFGSPLSMREGDSLGGFTIAGEDGRFVIASAEIVAQDASSAMVRVWSPDVPNPVHVRYAWKDNPEDANLINEEGLPAPPFRTDDLPGPTDGRR